MKLKEYLEKRKLTYEEFSKISGVTKSTLGNYVNGRSRALFDNATRIVKATKGQVTYEDLAS